MTAPVIEAPDLARQYRERRWEALAIGAYDRWRAEITAGRRRHWERDLLAQAADLEAIARYAFVDLDAPSTAKGYLLLAADVLNTPLERAGDVWRGHCAPDMLIQRLPKRP